MKTTGLMIVLASAMFGGCTNLDVKRLPIDVAVGEPKREPVPIYDDLNKPPRAIIPFATMRLSGANDYYSHGNLGRILAKEAASLGADCIWIGGEHATDIGSATSYSGGLAVSSRTVVNTVSATAAVYSPVSFGVNMDEKNVVTDVRPGSAAANAGVRIGDRVLAVNGVRITGDQLAQFKAMAKAKPGDRTKVELVGPDNQTRTLDLTWDMND